VRAKTIAAVLASAAIVALCLPGGAFARGGLVQIPGSSGKGPARRPGQARVTQKLDLVGTNGYKIFLSLEDRRRLQLEAMDADNHHRTLSDVTYSLRAPQQPGSDDIAVRIGGVARIDVHFVAAKTIKSAPEEGPECGARSLTTETGHYVGTISFRGERGYTSVRAHSAPGSVERQAPHKCKLPKPVEHDPAVEKEEAETVDKLEEEEERTKAEEAGEVALTAIDRGRKIAFAASRFEFASGAKTGTASTFIVVGTRHRGRVGEVATVAQFLTEGTYFGIPDSAKPTDEAILTPASPFSGSATFLGGSAGAARWSGDLKVELPAFGTVPLTGPGVKASMCAAASCPSDRLFSRRLDDGSLALP
jgi:hypothetical protein